VGPTRQSGAERGEGGAAGGTSPSGRRQLGGVPLTRRPAGPAERPRPSGGEKSGRSGRKEEVGRGWAETGAGPISCNETLSNFYLEF
jgi:hypothetical protein